MPTADVTSSSRPRARSASKYLKPPPRLDFLFFLYFFILKPSLSPGNKTTALPLQPIFRTLPHAASIALPLAGVPHFHQFTCCLHQVIGEDHRHLSVYVYVMLPCCLRCFHAALACACVHRGICCSITIDVLHELHHACIVLAICSCPRFCAEV